MRASMNALQHPDLFYLEAAKGWYYFGDLDEANRELDRITPAFQSHADVLEVRFALFAKAKKWTICMEISAALLDLAPDRPTAWINSAFTLHELAQTQDAWNALYVVRDRFPDVPTIPYNLACYACRLGRLDDSQEWLKRAFAIGGTDYKTLALQDPDLQPLWEKIHQI